jgi:bifunctional DNA-binding transcriptional regulator/antitoxin component of YhaV-PrlF toxin-antitoxin module
MMAEGKVNIEDLPAETREKLGLNKRAPIDKKVIALGKVISALSKLTVADAGWVLRQALKDITGERTKRGKNGKSGKQETVATE